MADATTSDELGTAEAGQRLANAKALYMQGIAEGEPKEAVGRHFQSYLKLG